MINAILQSRRGPLTDVLRGGNVELDQTLELLPGAMPAADGPDAWLAVVEAQSRPLPERGRPHA